MSRVVSYMIALHAYICCKFSFAPLPAMQFCIRMSQSEWQIMCDPSAPGGAVKRLVELVMANPMQFEVLLRGDGADRWQYDDDIQLSMAAAA